MKIFVGTLFSGENEYGECLASIRGQSFVDFDLFTFEHLPKLEAHRFLYHSFLNKKDEYDILVKIDADMVLTRTTLFDEIRTKFSQNAWLEVFTIGITDFFSDQLINGLNSYRNVVNWALEPGNMNADVVIADADHCYFDTTELAPAAIHCKNPSPLQAFHYGVHRGIKSIQRMYSTAHWSLLEKTRQNFLKSGDTRIGLAVLGAELVYAGKCGKSDVDYTNPRLSSLLDKYSALDRDSLLGEINRLRRQNWGFLPVHWRKRIIRRLRNYGDFPARRIEGTNPR